jgi:hypothetical protein
MAGELEKMERLQKIRKNRFEIPCLVNRKIYQLMD